VPGCGAVLDAAAGAKLYNLRYRLCEAHLRALEVDVGGDGVMMRFCQARHAARAPRCTSDGAHARAACPARSTCF
jgi:hypothetical protein